MSIYQGGTTNFFGDLVDNIEKFIGSEASKVVNSVHNALVEGTPATTGTGSPVDTGALRHNWNSGIRPNSNYVERKTSNYYPKPSIITKKYGINHSYYIWNNTPYISSVNDGITFGDKITDKSRLNIRFIEKAIDRGIENAKSS